MRGKARGALAIMLPYFAKASFPRMPIFDKIACHPRQLASQTYPASERFQKKRGRRWSLLRLTWLRTFSVQLDSL